MNRSDRHLEMLSCLAHVALDYMRDYDVVYGSRIRRTSPRTGNFMAEPAYVALFPLPLTAFERYMMDDDRADYPMTFPMKFQLSGEIHRPAFQSALDEALSRHPLLCARVERLRRRGLCFVHGSGQRPALDWDIEGVPPRFPNDRAIDLSREGGTRFWVRVGNGTATLLVQFHHACCDGLGAVRFLGDLFAGYATRTATEGAPPTRAPLELESLRTRGEFHVEYPKPVSLTRAVWSTLCETGKWIVRRPAPLAVPGPLASETGDETEYPGIEVHRFDEHQSLVLRQIASRSRATVNDLLLRDLFVTMREWNEKFQSGRTEPWMQINMPQSLRARSGDAMPAANKMSYVFLTGEPMNSRIQRHCLKASVWKRKPSRNGRWDSISLGG